MSDDFTNDNQTTQVFSEDDFKKTLEGMSDVEVLDLYLETMLNDKGMVDLDDEVRADMKIDLAERFNAFLSQAFVDALPSGKVVELDNMIDKNEATPENVKKLLVDANVDTDKITVDAMAKFREIYLGTDGDEAGEEA